MISLQTYLNENIIAENFDKSNLQAIKNWTKTIKKSSGRIKVDPNGCVTLPNTQEVELVGPFPENISFNEFECGEVKLKYVTQSEIEMITDVAQGVYALHIVIDENIDFSEMNLKLTGFSVWTPNQSTISGLKNIEILGSKGAKWLRLNNVQCEGSFKRGENVYIEFNNVTAKSDLLKNFTSVKGINIENSSPIDLHKIDVDTNCNLRDLDEKFAIGYFPHSTKNLWIESSVPFEKFDFKKIKTNAQKCHYNGTQFSPGASDDEQQIMAIVSKMKNDGKPIPPEFITCLKNLSSKVVSKKDINKEHMCVVVEINGKHDGELNHISIFKDGEWEKSLVYQTNFSKRWTTHQPYRGFGPRERDTTCPEIFSDEYYVIPSKYETLIYKALFL